MEPDEDMILIGDVVEHKMNTSVFGIVISGGGSLVSVRLSPSLAVLEFHEFEVRKVEDDEYVPDPGAEQDNSNVVDFTRAKELRASTKTRGAA